ncbi:MAG: hypothetical protein WA650_20665 [Bradyrhizobium sp.]
MSSGRYCLIRDLGLVKGGKGLRHHELLLELSWRGILQFAAAKVRNRAARSLRPQASKPIHVVPRLDGASKYRPK